MEEKITNDEQGVVKIYKSSRGPEGHRLLSETGADDPCSDDDNDRADSSSTIA